MPWDPYDYEERAAIIQFDGGFPQAQAERMARQIMDGTFPREKPEPAPTQMSFGAADDDAGRFWQEMERMYGRYR